MIASLPMYTTERTRGACDRFWLSWSSRLRTAGVEAPPQLTSARDGESVWTDANLVISQTCGYPYASSLRGRVRLVATPHYDVEGCDGANYVSWIIAHAGSKATGIEELRGQRAAINGLNSQSGYNSFRAVIAPYAEQEKFFSNVITSGGHVSSMRMVAAGDADCATIDAVSWTLMREQEPHLAAQLKRLGATPPVPGLPFITSGSRSDEELEVLRATLQHTLADPALRDDLKTMHMSGASVLSDAAYDACLDMETSAVAAGYPILA